MRLLVDQGNSRLKWCLVDEVGRIVADGASANDESLEVAFREVALVAQGRCNEVCASIVSAGRTASEMNTVAHRVLGVGVRFASSAIKFRELVNGYEDPARLGVDRWLAMIGALTVAKAPLLVVDAGTALTIDAIASDGRHLGGLIAPGLSMQRRALGAGTAISDLSLSVRGGSAWGCNTRDAVSNGTVMALAALVESRWIELAENLHDTCTLVMTGGDAEALASLMSVPYMVDEHLVFRGLWAWSGGNNGLTRS